MNSMVHFNYSFRPVTFVCCRGKFAITFALPSAVSGPVEYPPCHLQRRLPGTLRASHGWPSLRRLPSQRTRRPPKLFAPAYLASPRGLGTTGPNLFAPVCSAVETRCFCIASPKLIVRAHSRDVCRCSPTRAMLAGFTRTRVKASKNSGSSTVINRRLPHSIPEDHR